MSHYRVLHNFDAEDVVELTVRKGDVVRTRDAAAASSTYDGWIHVEAVVDHTDDKGNGGGGGDDEEQAELSSAQQRRRGFVPLSYLQELPPTLQQTTSSSSMARMTRAGDVDRHAHAALHDERADGDVDAHDMAPATPPRQQTRTPVLVADVTTPHTPPPQQQPLSLSSSPSQTHDATATATTLAQRVAQLSQQRAELLASLQATLLDAQAETAACRECGNRVTQAMRELEDVLADGQQRLRHCIDEQRAQATRALSGKVDGGNGGDDKGGSDGAAAAAAVAQEVSA